jgi:CHAT domain-containing protein/tetratricopeptide (TPR) repeat protein
MQRGLSSRDPDQTIWLMTLAAQVEAKIVVWTLNESRTRTRGLIFGLLGNGYKDRQSDQKTEDNSLAVESYRRALTFFTIGEFPAEFAVTQSNLCNVLQHGTRNPLEQDLTSGLEACNAALAVYTQKQFPEKWADVQFNIGNIYSSRSTGGRGNNLNAAVRAYQNALTVYTSGKHPREWARTQHNMGVAYYHLSNKDNVLVTDDMFVGLRQDNLGMAYRDPTLHKGIDLLAQRRAIEAYQAALQVYSRERFPDDFAREHNHLAIVYGEANNLDGQVSSATAALSVWTPQYSIEDHLRMTCLLGHALLKKRDWQAARTTFDRARLAYHEVAKHDAALARETISLFGPMFYEAAYVAAQTGDIRGALALLMESTGEPPTGTDPDPLEIARAVIPADGALVVPVITDAGSKFILLRRGPQRPDISVIDFSDFDMPLMIVTVWDWLRAFNIQYLPMPQQRDRLPKWRDAIDQIGDVLWKQFGAEFLNELHRVGLKPGARLVLLPAGAQGVLPIGLMRDPATGARLGEIFELTFAPGLRGLLAASAAVAGNERSLAAVVNPTGEIPELSLPYTEMEGASIARHFQADKKIVLGKQDADPSSVLNALKGKRYWHFSSHGEFDWSDTSKSGLIMRGRESLTIGRLMESTGSLGRPRLVVLSACETGLYDIGRRPEDFVGLPAAFMRLGAAGVIGSLWQVDDLATALLMARFYELHLDEGLSPPAALKTAQAWLRDATDQALMSYMKAERSRARFNPDLLDRLEAALVTGNRGDNSRFAPIWETFHTGASGHPTTSAAPRRPFSHPYYWGGFIYTGL